MTWPEQNKTKQHEMLGMSQTSCSGARQCGDTESIARFSGKALGQTTDGSFVWNDITSVLRKARCGETNPRSGF